MRIGIATVLISSVLLSAPAHAFDWLEANGKSCDVACQGTGKFPVISGNYTNGSPYYICAANAHGQGYRAGYNLQPAWSNVCVVGYGGNEEMPRTYKCLCGGQSGIPSAD